MFSLSYLTSDPDLDPECRADVSDLHLYCQMYYLTNINVQQIICGDQITVQFETTGEHPGVSVQEYERRTTHSVLRVDAGGLGWALLTRATGTSTIRKTSENLRPMRKVARLTTPDLEPDNVVRKPVEPVEPVEPVVKDLHGMKRGIQEEHYTVAILTTDRRETFGIENRKKKDKNFFQKTYSIIKSVYEDVLVVTDVKTSLYNNVERIEIWQPAQPLEVHMHAKAMYTHALTMDNGNGILIFEDDVDLTKQFRSLLGDAINVLKDKNIDRFIIECYNVGGKGHKRSIHGALVETNYYYGTQCMYFSHSVVKELYEKMLASTEPYDLTISHANIAVFNFRHKSLTQHMGSHQSTGLGGGLHETSLFSDSIGEDIDKRVKVDNNYKTGKPPH